MPTPLTGVIIMKTNRIKKIIIALSFFQLGCEAVHSPVPDDVNQETNIKTKISFEQIKANILEPHCINCHTGRHRAYENYALVKSAAQEILNRVTTANLSLRMPQQRPVLDENLIAQLREWVNAGAPEFPTADNETEEPKEPEVFVGFSDIQQKIITPQCIGCHTHFEDYSVVKKQLGSIFSFVMQDKMPFPRRKNTPIVPLSNDLKDLLTQWVNNGAPFTKENPKGPETSDEIKPNWISIRNNILGPKCILCHNSYGPRAPTKMGTYQELQDWFVNSPKLFDFDNPNNSHFIGSMLGRVNPDNDEFFFDPMPFNSTADDVPTDIDPVSSQDILIIEKWIELKLPEKEVQ